jgi:ubiquinone/menaquinone biosynthesis C-methylase UbiE
MATVMATGNADMENAAVDVLKSRPDAKVLMIGCGPGVGVVAAARRALNGLVIGLDTSAVMVQRTRARSRRSWHADLDLETLMGSGTTRGTPKTESRHLQQLGIADRLHS